MRAVAQKQVRRRRERYSPVLVPLRGLFVFFFSFVGFASLSARLSWAGLLTQPSSLFLIHHSMTRLDVIIEIFSFLNTALPSVAVSQHDRQADEGGAAVAGNDQVLPARMQCTSYASLLQTETWFVGGGGVAVLFEPPRSAERGGHFGIFCLKACKCIRPGCCIPPLGFVDGATRGPLA